jgi:TrmH family RNA methyltransferase
VGTVMQGLSDLGVRRAATVVRGGTPYDAADLTGPIALVLGSEAHGLPEQVLEQADELLTIPMAGRTESLNVAMAGAVVCFESLRQRRTRS